jgi:hypothetical protein
MKRALSSGEARFGKYEQTHPARLQHVHDSKYGKNRITLPDGRLIAAQTGSLMMMNYGNGWMSGGFGGGMWLWTVIGVLVVVLLVVLITKVSKK